MPRVRPHCRIPTWSKCVFCVFTVGVPSLCSLHQFAAADPPPMKGSNEAAPHQLPTAPMLVDYYHRMSVPKPFVVREGDAFEVSPSTDSLPPRWVAGIRASCGAIDGNSSLIA